MLPLVSLIIQTRYASKLRRPSRALRETVAPSRAQSNHVVTVSCPAHSPGQLIELFWQDVAFIYIV